MYVNLLLTFWCGFIFGSLATDWYDPFLDRKDGES